jgi:putative membrane protein
MGRADVTSQPQLLGAPAPVTGALGAPTVTTGERSTPRRALRFVELAVLVAGLVLFAALVRQLGAGVVLANLRLVGWGIALIVGQEIFAYLANTLGWRAAFPRRHPRVAFRHLLTARIAGDAVNYVTPTATVGGEFVRLHLLHGRAATIDIATSVAVAKVSQTVGQVAFIVAGLALTLTHTSLPPAIRLGLVLGAVALSALVVALVLAQRHGMLAPLMRIAAVFGQHQRLATLTGRLRSLDEEIARFHGAKDGAFLLSSTYFLGGWALGALEIYLMLWFLGLPASIHHALTIEVLSVAIDATLFFVPGKVGTQEGGKVLIFTLLGLDPAKGLSVGILRRIRELSWALVGLAILSRRHLAARPAAA